MKFTSTLVLGLLISFSAQAAVQLKGTLAQNDTVQVIDVTTELNQSAQLNDTTAVMMTECEEGCCFNVTVTVDGEAVTKSVNGTWNNATTIDVDAMQLSLTAEQN